MFDKFGEFNSSAEINELAENLFDEGVIWRVSKSWQKRTGSRMKW